MVYMHAIVAAFCIMLSMVKMLLKREVRGCAFNSHGESCKNHGIVFLNFCGNPVLPSLVWSHSKSVQ